MRSLTTARLLQSTARLLVRHCRHADVGKRLTGRGEDGGLTAEGQAEATSLAEQLAAWPIDAVYCSPRRRTRETAAVIAARVGLPIMVALPLDEIEFGAWTGKRFAELEGDPAWDEWNRVRASARPPGGESMAEAIARAAAFIAAAPDRGTAVFVTHCDIIRGLLCRADERSFDHLFAYTVEPGSVTPLVPGRLEQAA